VSHLPLGNRPVRQPDRRSAAEVIRITGLIFGFAAPFIAYMWVSASQLEGEYHLSKLIEQRTMLGKERDRLLLTREALLSPAVADRVAREKLGMVEEDRAEMSLADPPPEGSSLDPKKGSKPPDPAAPSPAAATPAAARRKGPKP
jgi:hypothetical protein